MKESMKIPGGPDNEIYMEVTFMPHPTKGKGLIREHVLTMPDPRELPHNHSDPMHVQVLSGGYTHICYVVQCRQIARMYVQTVRAGMTYTMPTNVFHKITAVESDTRTLVEFLRVGVVADMEYFDPESNTFSENRTDFLALKKANPER